MKKTFCLLFAAVCLVKGSFGQTLQTGNRTLPPSQQILPPTEAQILSPSQVQANGQYPLLRHDLFWDAGAMAWRGDSLAVSFRYWLDGAEIRRAYSSFSTGDSTYLETHQKDSRGVDTAYTLYHRVGNGWQLDTRIVTEYDANGNPIHETYWGWDTNQHAPSPQFGHDYVYDAQGRRTEQIAVQFDSALVRKQYYKTVYSFTGTAVGADSIIEYDGSAGTWVPTHKWADFTYSSAYPDIPTMSRHYIWQDTAFVVIEQRSGTYTDPNNSSFTTQSITFDTLGNEILTNLEMAIKASRGDTLFYENYGHWLPGGWSTGNRVVNVFDSRGNFTLTVRQAYDNPGWHSTQGTVAHNYYDGAGNLTHLIYDQFVPNTGQYVRMGQLKYFNFITLSAARPLVAAEMLIVYPSPAASQVSSPADLAQLQVYDASGKAYRIELNGAQANVSGLKPGLYQIQATGKGGKAYRGRFIKE